MSYNPLNSAGRKNSSLLGSLNDMKNYRQLIKEHYESDSSDEIDNGSIEHARVVVEYLFKKSQEQKKDIKIITGCLEADFYNNFVDVAKKILENNKISIISLSECHDSEFKSLIEKSSNANLIVPENKFSSLPHFILVGDNAYRFEHDDILKTARASFNKESFGKFLATFFNDVKKLAYN